MKSARIVLALMLAGFLLAAPYVSAQDQTEAAAENKKPAIAISKQIDDVMIREAAKVKAEFQQQARLLFARHPLGWDLDTIRYLYQLTLSLPERIPAFTRFVIEQSKILGVIGSILIFLLVVGSFYSLLGQRRVMRWVEHRAEPLTAYIPEAAYPFFISGIRVVVSALIPLSLLGVFALINALIDYSAAWFQLVGRLLGFWTVGALLLRLLKEVLTRDLFTVTARYGPTIHLWARLALLYAIVGTAVYWTVEVFNIREDVLALLRFAISVSITIVLLILHFHKQAFISLLPELPIPIYMKFRRFLEKYYFPLLMLLFAAALLWCFGYKALGRTILFKLWFTAAAFVFIMLLYEILQRRLDSWRQKLGRTDESARLFAGALRSILKFATVLAVLLVVLNMLGLLKPLQQLMSFPIFYLGETVITFWLLVKAVLILLALAYLTRLFQAYFDYKIYPSFGVDPGLGYAINTVFKYTCYGIGIIIVLNTLGINLRFLLVFAGAIGVGVGFGLQSMAANVISGFTIIFGGKIRKGDWIEVESMMGEVTDIFLRATKVRTRDNIEYLIPNSNMISNTMVNYSLSSPLIRIELPVGVSYGADPRQVEKILMAAAENEPLLDKAHSPTVRFTEYADSSINFELLVWIDVRRTPRRKVRSNLYFVIFAEFAKAGIEIPFPQRDIHIRSQVDAT